MKRPLLALAFLLGAMTLAAPINPEPSEEQPAKVDQAVKKGIAFLASNQAADGSWVAPGGNPAISSLAVMAFLSAGHVPGEGKYGDQVTKGIKWVLSKQQRNGLIATAQGQEMYQHAICTLMLAEAAGMTDGDLGEVIRKKLGKAIDLILQAQRANSDDDRGGWRYRLVGRDADISVTAWQIMALRAAKNLGCDVPAEVIEKAVGYVKRCQDPITGGFRYMVHGPVTVPCTGASILALELCGKDQHLSRQVVKAGSYLIDRVPTFNSAHFYYSAYYCSQACFQLDGNYWKHFRPLMQRQLVDNQKLQGHWMGGDSDANIGGVNYCTSMALLALTVEYRYLPIYQRNETPAAKEE